MDVKNATRQLTEQDQIQYWPDAYKAFKLQNNHIWNTLWSPIGLWFRWPPGHSPTWNVFQHVIQLLYCSFCIQSTLLRREFILPASDNAKSCPLTQPFRKRSRLRRNERCSLSWDEERIFNKRERLSSSTKMGRSSGEYLQRSVGPRTYLSGKWAITQQANKYSDAKSNIYFTKMSPFLIGTHCSYMMIQRCPRVSWLTKESRTPENIAIWPGRITQHCQWNKHRTAKMIIKAIQTRNSSVLVGYRLWGEIGYKGLRTLGVRKQRFWDGRTSQDRAVICKHISKTTQAVKHAMVWLYAAVFDWTSWLSWVFHTMSDSSPYLP